MTKKYVVNEDLGELQLLAEGEVTAYQDWDTGIYKAYTEKGSVAQELIPYNKQKVKIYIEVKK